LWQLPPSLALDVERLKRFAELLPRDRASATALAARHDERVDGRAFVDAPATLPTLRHAIEPRHTSWLTDEAHALLASLDLALVVADTAGKHPMGLERTAGFMYVRLHGDEELYASRYGDAALDRWAARIATWRKQGDVFVYFDNDMLGHAPHDAERLRTRVERRGRTEPQPTA
jgi:uncharacterized protein YecE (DUF72 family)